MKKQYSRLIALVCAAAMLCSLAFTVNAGPEGPSPVFALDLAGFDPASADAAKGLRDAAGSPAEITANTVTGGSFTLGSGVETKYLAFAKNDPAAKNVVVTDPGLGANPMAYSVEMWANVDFESCAPYAKLMETASGDMQTVQNFVQTFIHSNNPNYKTALTMAGNTSAATAYESAAGYVGKWTHYVFTWQWAEDESAVSVGMYADGKSLMNRTLTLAEGTERAKVQDMIFTLGCLTNSWENPADMLVGSFNLYDRALTREQADSLYQASVGRFVYVDPMAPAFAMDLSGYSAESTLPAKGIKDASGNGAAITANTAQGGGFTAINGNDTKYVAINNANAKNIKIDTSAMGANPRQMSFEIWANVDFDSSAKYAKLFSLTAANGYTDVKANVQLFTHSTWGKCVQLNVAGQSPYGNAEEYFNQWTHYVATYDWNEDNTSVRAALYANGTKVAEQPERALDRVTDPEKFIYYIGGSDRDTSAAMKVSSFKMYNRVLSEAEIRDAYQAEAENYVPAQAKPEFTAVAYDVTSVREGAMTAQTTVKNYTGRALPVTMVSALYKNGRLTDTAAQAYIVPNGTEAMTLDVEIALTAGPEESPEEYALKTFVWDGLETACPYIAAGELSAQKPAYTVAFLGGSITEGAGAADKSQCYVSRMESYFQEKYAKDYTVNVINAGKGGTPSSLGSYRLGLEVIPAEPDVVFVEFAQNDNYSAPYGYREAQRNMESIVRQLLQLEKKPEIVFLYTTNASLGRGAAGKHEAIAEYYNIPAVDLSEALKNEIAVSQKPAAAYFAENDTVHPNEAGHGVYADAIQSAIDSGILQTAHTWNDVAYTDFYVDRPVLVSFDQCTVNGNWTQVESDNKWIRQGLYSETAGDSISCTFTGACAGIYAFRTKDSGLADYTVTDQYGNLVEQGTVDLYGNNTYCEMFVSNLGAGSHTITMAVNGGKNSSSTGNKVQFGYFMTDPGSRYVPGDDTVKSAFETILAVSLFDAAEDVKLFPGANPSYINTLVSTRWARWNKIDFGDGGVTGMTATLSSGAQETDSLTMDIYLDSVSSVPVGTLTVKGTGNWNTYLPNGTAEFQSGIGSVKGVHDVYLVPRDNERMSYNLHSFQFTK